jgi:murein DD-endopeptidase MepM/ murein hydrolase activator NlpD
MRKVYHALLLATAILVFAISCKKNSNIEQPASAEIRSRADMGDSISVILPTGSAASGTVSLSTSTSKDLRDIFDETCHFFGASAALPYAIVINVGKNRPQDDSIAVDIKLPDYFLKKKESDFGFQLFALVYQDGGEEVLDHFVIGPSMFNPSTNTVRANLPAGFFTNVRTADKTYEAIVTVGLTPGANTGTPIQTPPGTGPIGGSGGACGASQISCPLGGVEACTNSLSTEFGSHLDPTSGVVKLHYGTDFDVPTGTPVFSVAAGEVIASKVEKAKNGSVTGFGEYIAIRHTDGSTSVYAQLSERNVKVGDKVTLGQQIGKSGNTGGSTRPHLHLEYYPSGKTFNSQGQINPFPCISGGNVNGSITVRDNGNLADDSFDLYLDGVLIGSTAIGASNSIALNNLRPGEKELKLTSVIAPDNLATYEILLDNGITFLDGSTSVSSTLDEGASVTWKIIVPTLSTPSLNRARMQPNAAVEK